MNAFRLKKQLWRRWRRWKKALWVGAACIAFTVLAWRSMQVPEEISGLLTNSSWADSADSELAAAVFKVGEDSDEAKEKGTLNNEQLLQTISQSGLSRTVHLKTTYVSGEEIQTLPGVKNPLQLKTIINEHPEGMKKRWTKRYREFLPEILRILVVRHIMGEKLPNYMSDSRELRKTAYLLGSNSLISFI